MYVLTHLTANKTQAPFNEPRGIVQVVADEPSPGFIRKVSLGAGGLVISHGENKVAIPLAELLALAEKHEPALAAPKE